MSSSAAAELARKRTILAQAFQEGGVPDFSLRHAKLFDTYFHDRLAEYEATRSPAAPARGGDAGEIPFAVVAVGGYGRSELCAHSDIDVVIIYPHAIPEVSKDLAKTLFFPLWDLNLDLGHGVRSIPECLELATQDYKVFASLIDARFLAGDPEVFQEFTRQVHDTLLPGRGAAFKEWLAIQNEVRTGVHGDATGLMEPNLKDGLGGLRDAHQVRWLNMLGPDNRPALPDEERDALEGHVRFLLHVRNHLHLLFGRKNDRLSLDAQRELATRLGFAGSADILPVETFLAELHRVMAEIRSLRLAAWSILAREGDWRAKPGKPLDEAVLLGPVGLEFAPGWQAQENPFAILDMFSHAMRLPAPLALHARRSIASGTTALAAAVTEGEGARRAYAFLVDALTRPGSGDALADMLETGVLAALAPEFARVQHMTQYDGFHIHPVGWHTLETILEIKNAAKPEHPYHAVFARIEHPERLFLGALFHDIGKGLGGGHSEKGMDIARQSLLRMGAGEAVVSDVDFLVLRHLILSETATRRDLSDKDVVAACASRVGSLDRLDMLLLLSMADGVATGPAAWNTWKSGLVGELYLKVRAVLEGGGLFDASDAQIMMGLRDKARVRGRHLYGPERLEELLDAMPPRYLLTRGLKDILGDLDLVSRLEHDLEEDRQRRPSHLAGLGVTVIDTDQLDGGHSWSLTLAARHHPALFATVAGVLALHDIDIRSADFFLWGNGTEIHCYHTVSPSDGLYSDELWARVRRAVSYALRGKLSLDYRIQEKRASPLAPKRPDLGVRPKVIIDNTSSEYYTLLEIRAADRIGLLYDIALCLETLGLQVHMAKISTSGHAVQDVFSVREADGRKPADPERLAEIPKTLRACLA